MDGDTVPAMPNALKDADASKDILHTLRHFHLGNPAIRKQLEPLADGLLPPLLNPYRDTAKLRYDYPLFLDPPSGETADEGDGGLARPIARFLKETTESFAPGDDDARILKDNLPRLEWSLRERLQGQEAAVDANPILAELASAMLKHLHLDNQSSEKLGADIERLLAAVPEGGQFLAYGRYPAIHLLIHVIRSRVTPRQVRFRQQVQARIRGLNLLLDVEKGKSPEAIEPDGLKGSVGFGASLFDPSALSKVMDHSHGSIGMSSKRLERIQDALATLESYQENEVRVRFVHIDTMDQAGLEAIPGFELISSPEPCVQATELFDQEAERLARIFAAARIAKLEIDGLYDPAIHDPWFDNFTWEAFSQDELLLVPAVMALESAERMAGPGMSAFSQLLNSGRPVHIMIRILAHANPGIAIDQDPFSSFRTELGYIGISHRQAVVSQVSASRHEHLLEQFSTALEATRTSLHLINVGLRPIGQDIGLNAWLVAGAALEGRAHPFFHINPSMGDSFAERMDFSGNPQPERDWPITPFTYRNENGELEEIQLAFTFADYALLINQLHQHFAPVPLICESDDLLPVADYLSLTPEQAEKSVPFIWAIDKSGELRQLAVTRTLVQACRDRLNFWHTLQEMAGVRNRYVELAVEKTRREITTQAETDRERLQEEHEREIEAVRKESAGEVLGRLTDVLLGMDFTAAAPRVTERTAAAVAEEPVEQKAKPEALEEEEEEAVGGFEDPWIDSPLCTTCNDCLKINPIMFVYNESNQAIIADVSAGTYLQMVEAAELCPSKCIHPGQPLNPDEPGLDGLIKRAAPFN